MFRIFAAVALLLAIVTSAFGQLVGPPGASSLAGLGTGVATALGINVGSAGSVVVNGGALGTPSSGTLTSATGLPLGGLTTQATNTVVGNATAGSAVPTALAVGTCSTAGSGLIWTTNTGFGCNTSITAAAVPVSGITSLGQVSNALGADVNLSNTGQFFDGPSVNAGSAGIVFAYGSVTVADTAGAASILCKLWDGTTVISSGLVLPLAANVGLVISLGGFLATPAGNIKISCQDASSTSGKIKFNMSGASKDATLYAYRVQ